MGHQRVLGLKEMELKKKGEKHQHGLERFISLNVRPWLLEFSSLQEAQNLFKVDKWILKEDFTLWNS